MSSNYEDPSTWRLRSNNGTVPLKFLGLEGDFESEQASVTFKALIPARSIIKFMSETFPPPVFVGNLSIPQGSSLPGLPGLIAKKVSFKHQDSSLPIDPFGFDLNAPANTYYPVIEVAIQYGMSRLQQPDPQDPFTFLEISCRGTGEFINSNAPGAKWQNQAPDPNDTKGDGKPGANNNPRLPGVPAAKGTAVTEPVKDPTVPIVIQQSNTEWNVKWNQIPYLYFQNVLMYRLRYCKGKVNGTLFPLLFNAEPETILFDKFNVTETFTWRNGQLGAPPINLEMTFLEKRAVWNGVVCGHNHFWRPGKGWAYLLMNGKTAAETAAESQAAYAAWVAGGKTGNPPTPVTGGPIYQARDLNTLFEV